MKTFSKTMRDWFAGFPKPEPAAALDLPALAAWSTFGLFLMGLLALMYFAHVVIVPVVAAAVTAVIFSPVSRWLERRGLPPGLSSLCVLIGLLLAFLAGGAAVVPTARDLGERIPYMAARIDLKLADIRSSLRSLEEARKALDQATKVGGEQGQQRQQVEVRREAAGIDIGQLLFQIGLFVVLTYFLLASRIDYKRRLILAQPSQAERLRTARILRDMGNSVSSYLFTVTTINIGLGIVTGVALAALGMPFAVLLGFGIALLNFVLIIGPILVIAATAILSLATFNDWELILAAPGIVLALHLIESQFVSPWLIGRRLEISPISVFAAIALLGWMWGAVGAMVAVPILILLYTFGKHIPALSPLAAMIGPTEGTDEDQEEEESKTDRKDVAEAEAAKPDDPAGRIKPRDAPPPVPDPDADQPKNPLGVLPSPLG
jgi:predicted PurR-regulated permease PerM